MRIKKSLDNLSFRLDIEDSDYLIYTSLDTIQENQLLKLTALFDNIQNALMKGEKQQSTLIQKMSADLNGFIYRMLEKEYENKEEIIDKKFDLFKDIIDSLYLNCKVYYKHKEHSIIELESKINSMHIGVIKTHLLFFLCPFLLSQIKLEENQKVGTIKDLGTLWYTSYNFMELISYLRNTNQIQ